MSANDNLEIDLALEDLCLENDEALLLARRLLTETSEEAAELSFERHICEATVTVLARHPDWHRLGNALFDAFERVDLRALLEMSNYFAVGGAHVPVLVGMIAADLRRHLGEVA